MSTADRTRAIIAEQFDKPEPDDDARFIEDLGADSLDVVELRLRLENEFSVSLEYFDDLVTVGAVVKHMEKIIDE